MYMQSAVGNLLGIDLQSFMIIIMDYMQQSEKSHGIWGSPRNGILRGEPH